MMVNFSAPLSGISAGFLRQDVVANNVANVNTGNFNPSRTRQQELPNRNGTQARVQGPSPTPSLPENISPLGPPSNVQLGREFVDSIMAKNSTAASVKTIQVQNEMLGTVLDIIR